MTSVHLLFFLIPQYIFKKMALNLCTTIDPHIQKTERTTNTKVKDQSQSEIKSASSGSSFFTVSSTGA